MDWLLDHENTGRGTFVLSSWLFLRALAIIYGIAFISLAVQVRGLIGRHGILPAAELLEQEKKLWGKRRFLLLPSVCWWNSRDGFLTFLCWAGAFLSLLLVLGVAPVPVLILLWLLYLSLFTVCRIFLSYQWDILLLETGFLAIFLAPLEMLPSWPPAASPSPVILWLYYGLLFRLMFASGVVKWRSGDPNWRNLTALKYHYETQPLPTPMSWYAHQLPTRFHKFSTLVMFVIEIVFPFLLFGPLPLRYLAVTAFVFLMLLIMLTGNYCFFNLNTIALCLLVVDDSIYSHFLPDNAPTSVAQVPQWPGWIIMPVAAVILVLSLERMLQLFRVQGRWMPLLEQCSGWFEPFRVVNSYGLFSVMTSVRLEIIIEGSDDGQTWLPYEFKWKPGDVKRRPRWVQPHQPRLDWQMWFAALSDYRANPWFVTLLIRLLQGKPAVRALIKSNPFPETPPRLIRAVLYEYRFTDWKTGRKTKVWWRRERRWLYSPVLSLRGREERFMPPADFRS